MTGKPQKLLSTEKKRKSSGGEKKHLDELLDEALKETFPASDPAAMLEPVSDLQQADKKGTG